MYINIKQLQHLTKVKSKIKKGNGNEMIGCMIK